MSAQSLYSSRIKIITAKSSTIVQYIGKTDRIVKFPEEYLLKGGEFIIVPTSPYGTFLARDMQNFKKVECVDIINDFQSIAIINKNEADKQALLAEDYRLELERYQELI